MMMLSMMTMAMMASLPQMGTASKKAAGNLRMIDLFSRHAGEFASIEEEFAEFQEKLSDDKALSPTFTALVRSTRGRVNYLTEKQRIEKTEKCKKYMSFKKYRKYMRRYIHHYLDFLDGNTVMTYKKYAEARDILAASSQSSINKKSAYALGVAEACYKHLTPKDRLRAKTNDAGCKGMFEFYEGYLQMEAGKALLAQQDDDTSDSSASTMVSEPVDQKKIEMIASQRARGERRMKNLLDCEVIQSRIACRHFTEDSKYKQLLRKLEEYEAELDADLKMRDDKARAERKALEQKKRNSL